MQVGQISRWLLQSFFDYMKSKMVSALSCTGQTLMTFPGLMEHSRGAGGVKGGYAAAKRSRPLTPPSSPRPPSQISGECLYLLLPEWLDHAKTDWQLYVESREASVNECVALYSPAYTRSH